MIFHEILLLHHLNLIDDSIPSFDVAFYRVIKKLREDRKRTMRRERRGDLKMKTVRFDFEGKEN